MFTMMGLVVVFVLAMTSVLAMPTNLEKSGIPQGFRLVERDIVEESWPDSRNAHSSERKLWPLRTVPYTFAKSFDSQSRRAIIAGFELIETNTCIKFKPRVKEVDYLKIIEEDGCWSFVGRRGKKQEISLPTGCRQLQTVVHELMHTLGFYHEHNRFDRDEYVDIRFQNIEKDNYDQFERRKQSKSKVFRPFDFMSTMLYEPNSFSKNKRNTIVSKVKGKRVLRDEGKPSMSAGDILSLNKLYKCAGYL